MSKRIRFGIIGCGLMGKEFASAAARWCHLTGDIPTPEIVGVCDFNESAIKWFTDNFNTIKYVTSDYKNLIGKEDIDAIYCALPHNLHSKVYSDIIQSGKHLLGEKPFGIDKAANEEILQALKENPQVVVRCASEFPFFPACQELIRWIKSNKFGKIIEVHAGFKHSSDMDLTKPINWKRTVEINGEYGCMGDLGIHTQHVPFRMGWTPKSVYAVLSDICKERPDGKGGMAPCKTWDNATLVCETEDKDGNTFPMFLETKRMSPGSTDEWFIEVYGLEASGKFNSNDPNAFMYTQAVGKEQAWCRLNVGYKPQFPTITGGIFEFGFTDSILQMWCSFMKEVSGDKVEFGCFTPEETRLSHNLLTAALESYKEKKGDFLMRYWDYKNIDISKAGDISQVAGLRRYEFTEGKAKGIEAVDIHTGSGLCFTVLPGRGMDIAWISYRGVPLSYISKTGIVSPAYYESEGMNWLHTFFAGGLTTCGLLNVGGPEEVEHPVIGKRMYGLHGRISNTCAEQVSTFEDFENGEYKLKVSGVVKEGILHGESLSLRREIETSFGKSEFIIRDTVTNRGTTEQDIMLLYHINIGYPLLDEGTRIECDANKVVPQSDEATKELKDAFKFGNPVQGIGERCYYIDLNPDETGNVSVSFLNDTLDLGVQLTYKKEQLPFFNEWKMLNKKEYVVGLEPCTALPHGYQNAKESGSIITLMPGESRVFEITYKVLDGKEV